MSVIVNDMEKEKKYLKNDTEIRTNPLPPPKKEMSKNAGNII